MSRKKLYPMDFVVINAGQVAVGTSSSGAHDGRSENKKPPCMNLK